MIQEDLDEFCSLSASPKAKVAAFDRILHSVSVNSHDRNILYKKFDDVCAILFGLNAPLLETSTIYHKLLSLLLLSSQETSKSLPIMLQRTLHRSGGVFETNMPFFLFPRSDLPKYVRTSLTYNMIESLPPFFSSRIHMKPQTPTNRKNINESIPTIPELRLDILEYYLCCFIRYPIIHSSLKTQLVSRQKVPVKEDWRSKLSSLSPMRRASVKPKKQSVTIYLNILRNYLEHYVPYVPYQSRETTADSFFLDMIIHFWMDYGNVSHMSAQEKSKELEIPSDGCIDGISTVIDYFISDPSIGVNRKRWRGKEIQKPFFDFLTTSFDLWSEFGSKKIFSKIIDMWLLYIQPWKKHEEESAFQEIGALSSSWEAFVKENLLFYIIPAEKFLQYAKMNFNCATRKGDLLLLETFVSSFLYRDLFEHLHAVVHTLLEIETARLYTSQSRDPKILQNHVASMGQNLSALRPLFSPKHTNLPRDILENLANDIKYCWKNAPENSEVARIQEIAQNFAKIFKLEPEWKAICPTLKGSKSRAGKKRRTNTGRPRVRDVALSRDYWRSPLLRHENRFVAEQSYHLAMDIQSRYGMANAPRIRWLASYQIWFFSVVCLVLLFALWKISITIAYFIIVVNSN